MLLNVLFAANVFNSWQDNMCIYALLSSSENLSCVCGGVQHRTAKLTEQDQSINQSINI